MLQERPLISLKNEPTGYKEIYNEHGDYMSTTTMRYNPVEHSIVKQLAENTLDEIGLDYTTSEILEHNGRDALYRYTIEGFNEEVKPQVVIRNTYKAGKSLKLYTGAFTMVCSNGSILGQKHGELSHMHIKDYNGRIFVGGINDFIMTFDSHLEFLENMKEIQLNEELAKESLGRMGFSDRNKKNILYMFNNQSNSVPENRRDNSLHSMYQSATEYFTNQKMNENNKLDAMQKITTRFTTLLDAA